MSKALNPQLLPGRITAAHCSLITTDGSNAENTFRCLCTCPLCNDNRLTPIQWCIFCPRSCPSLCEIRVTWTRRSTCWTGAPTWRASGSCCSLRSTAMWDAQEHKRIVRSQRTVTQLPFLHYKPVLRKIEAPHYFCVTLTGFLTWSGCLIVCQSLLLFSFSPSCRPPPPPTTFRASRWGSSPPSPLETWARRTSPPSPGGATHLLVHIFNCHSNSSFNRICNKMIRTLFQRRTFRLVLYFSLKFKVLQIFFCG